MISPKDIADMFAELEIYLIQSFKRNLKRHQDWEKDEGFEWSAWQAEKLREINIFRRQNKKIAKNFISRILPDTRKMLIQQYQEGSDTTPSFFGINERRLNGLIDEMLTIEQDVTKAALRNVDDAYRQTILKAAAAQASGTMTLYQAVDMASKEFLSKGINCIQYKDGRRVNIVSYAEMALRTNATRSRLYGQRAKMKEMGIDTVIISQYGGCSPTCLPWQGKVYIDDVFGDFDGKKGISWGVSSNGNDYMLLSHAMKNGLFHPNCRHNARIYIEGVTRIPAPLDKDTVNKNYALEQQQRKLERQVRQAKRLEAGVLDEEKKKEYTIRRKLAEKELKTFVDEHSDILRRDLWRENPTDYIPDMEYMSAGFRPEFGVNKEISVGNGDNAITIEVKPVTNSSFSLYADKDFTRRNKAVRFVEKSLRYIRDNTDGEIPTVVVVDFDKYKLNSDAIAGYDRATETIYFNAKYDTTVKVVDYISRTAGYFANKTEYAPLLHEIGHYHYDNYVKNLAKSREISYNESEYIVKKLIYQKIEDMDGAAYVEAISKYAYDGYNKALYSEIFAELYSVGRSGEIL